MNATSLNISEELKKTALEWAMARIEQANLYHGRTSRHPGGDKMIKWRQAQNSAAHAAKIMQSELSLEAQKELFCNHHSLLIAVGLDARRDNDIACSSEPPLLNVSVAACHTDRLKQAILANPFFKQILKRDLALSLG